MGMLPDNCLKCGKEETLASLPHTVQQEYTILEWSLCRKCALLAASVRKLCDGYPRDFMETIHGRTGTEDSKS